MSNRSRGRLAANASEGALDGLSDEDKQRMDEGTKAFEQANTRTGLAKFVGMLLEDRKRQLEPGKPADANPTTLEYEGPGGDRWQIGGQQREPIGLREPTPFQRAILYALGDHPIYGGTVEPDRIAKRRRRNRIARKSRRANRLAAKR